MNYQMNSIRLCDWTSQVLIYVPLDKTLKHFHDYKIDSYYSKLMTHVHSSTERASWFCSRGLLVLVQRPPGPVSHTSQEDKWSGRHGVAL